MIEKPAPEYGINKLISKNKCEIFINGQMKIFYGTYVSMPG